MSVTVKHLNETEKLNSFISQDTGYHCLDVIYTSNRQQEKCLQSASTFIM
jgi:hypothetical protein